jgi:stress-induced morphogen
MAMTANEIEELLLKSFPNAKITIDDLRGDGDHYAAKIVTAEFKGKTRVQQHQMVYNAMNGKMGTDLHALALNTSAPKN